MQAPLPPPSSIDALINVHDLNVLNAKDALSLSLSFVNPQQDEELQKELEAITALSKDLLRAKVDVPPIPQAPTRNSRTDMVNTAKEQGNVFYKKGQYAEAIQKYTMAISFASTRPLFEGSFYAREELAPTLCNRCAAYTMNGQLVEALVDADAVIKVKKGWPKGHFRKGKVLLAMNRLQEAKEAYLLGLEFDPEEKDLLAALEEVNKLIVEKQSSKSS